MNDLPFSFIKQKLKRSKSILLIFSNILAILDFILIFWPWIFFIFYVKSIFMCALVILWPFLIFILTKFLHDIEKSINRHTKNLHNIYKWEYNQEILDRFSEDWKKITCLKDINNPVYDLLLNEYVIAIYAKRHFDNKIKLKIVYLSKEGEEKELEWPLTLDEAKDIIDLDNFC